MGDPADGGRRAPGSLPPAAGAELDADVDAELETALAAELDAGVDGMGTESSTRQGTSSRSMESDSVLRSSGMSGMQSCLGSS